MKTALIVAMALTAHPFAAHAQIVNPAAQMTSLTPAAFAERLRAMDPNERKETLEAYRAYLENLDAALAQAQSYSATNHGKSVEIVMTKTGFGFLIAGGVLLVPSLYMSKSTLVIVNFFGKLGLRAAGGVAGVGAILLAGAGLSVGTKIALNQFQVAKLRKSIAHIHAQLNEIESLTLK